MNNRPAVKAAVVVIIIMKSRELGPEHSTQNVARYASACGPTNPGH